MYTKKIVSIGTTNKPTIHYNGIINSPNTEVARNITNVVQMQYNEYERLLLKATSGNYSRVVTIIPSENTNINFDFIEATDIDGNNYPVVSIGAQTWMAENLKVSHYPNGNAIEQLVAGSSSSYEDFYCFYNYSETEYGALYSYAAATADNWQNDNVDNQGICPDGWHIPSDDEYNVLIETCQGSDFAGARLKEIGTTHWISPNTGAYDRYGFTALPGGYRNSGGSFDELGYEGWWWTGSEVSAYSGVFIDMKYNEEYIGGGHWDKARAMSVRCVKN